MIPVSPQPEPEDFSKKVRIPGHAFLRENPEHGMGGNIGGNRWMTFMKHIPRRCASESSLGINSEAESESRLKPAMSYAIVRFSVLELSAGELIPRRAHLGFQTGKLIPRRCASESIPRLKAKAG